MGQWDSPSTRKHFGLTIGHSLSVHDTRWRAHWLGAKPPEAESSMDDYVVRD